LNDPQQMGVGGQSAGILETGAFLRQSPKVDFATQSGPLLVINGRLNPRFPREGGSRKYRNGVGVRDASGVVFAISEDEVSFGSFARLFRDRLKCANALFLDGGECANPLFADAATPWESAAARAACRRIRPRQLRH
jgi:uncharacterized protein YigE (DUF2233 family)